MSNKPGFFRQLKDTQNYSTKFLIVLFSPNSGVTPIITDDLYGRSGVVFGAYLPYGSVQSDVMGQMLLLLMIPLIVTILIMTIVYQFIKNNQTQE